MAATPETREPIAAIALTGQMHGAVMLDENGAVLRPALIWCDTRTQPECDWLTEKIGYERLIELTCNPALPNFTLTKLLWVKTHQPEIFAKIRHVMCPKDYVRYRLTGEFAIDVQEASGTLLLDVTHRRWSREVAEAAGIEMSWLPKVYESPEICARISEKAAGLTGLTGGNASGGGRGRPGRGRGGHGHSAAGQRVGDDRHFGRGVCGDGRADERSEGTLHTFCHAVPGRWHVMGVTQSAGLSLNWLRGTFFAGQSYDALSEAAEKIPAGSEGLEWAPYLLGERTPHLDPEVRAAFAGIGVQHTAAHFVRAVLEGVAYSLAGHVYAVSGAGHSGDGDSPGRRRRARSAVAEDSGGHLRPGGGSAGGRRRRRVWLRADGRRGRGTLEESRRGVRAGDQGGAAHRAGRRRMWRPTRPATRSGGSCIRRCEG